MLFLGETMNILYSEVGFIVAVLKLFLLNSQSVSTHSYFCAFLMRNR